MICIRPIAPFGDLARESPDGRFVYYTKSDPYLSYAKNKQVDGLWRAPVDGGAETRVLETVKLRGFEVVEDGIYFFALGPKSQTLVRFHNHRTTCRQCGRCIATGYRKREWEIARAENSDGPKRLQHR